MTPLRCTTLQDPIERTTWQGEPPDVVPRLEETGREGPQGAGRQHTCTRVQRRFAIRTARRPLLSSSWARLNAATRAHLLGYCACLCPRLPEIVLVQSCWSPPPARPPARRSWPREQAPTIATAPPIRFFERPPRLITFPWDNRAVKSHLGRLVRPPVNTGPPLEEEVQRCPYRTKVARYLADALACGGPSKLEGPTPQHCRTAGLLARLADDLPGNGPAHSPFPRSPAHASCPVAASPPENGSARL